MKKQLPLVVIVGPTAVGKTEVGIRLADKIGGEVISGDSMQVYKNMDIGTAKPTEQEMAGIPHHLINVVAPGEEFNVAKFQEMAEKCIEMIVEKGKIPILAGGTGLYVRSVIDVYDFTPPGGDNSLRSKLLTLAGEKGNGYLVEMLEKVDLAAAKRIHPNDTRRLVRALEVYKTLGRPISEFQSVSGKAKLKYNLAYFGLYMNRQKLYEKVEKRVDLMMEKGLVNEVSGLVEKGYGPEHTSMQALGYKEILYYFSGFCTLGEAAALIKRNSRRFAKRQMTWFKRDSRIIWYDVEKYNSLEEIANEIAARAEGQFSNT